MSQIETKTLKTECQDSSHENHSPLVGDRNTLSAVLNRFYSHRYVSLTLNSVRYDVKYHPCHFQTVILDTQGRLVSDGTFCRLHLTVTAQWKKREWIGHMHILFLRHGRFSIAKLGCLSFRYGDLRLVHSTWIELTWTGRPSYSVIITTIPTSYWLATAKLGRLVLV